MSAAVKVVQSAIQVDECVSYDLEIVDYDLLVQLMVEVTLGKAQHVSKILHLNRSITPRITVNAFESAASFLSKTNNGDVSHRDGWMFQVISWLSTLNDPKQIFSRVPHTRRHQSGLDGFSLVLKDGLDEIDHAIIFEEKATIYPRKQFKDKVLPELKNFESGNEESIITSEILSFEDKLAHIDIESVAEDILIKREIRYRVTMTTESMAHIQAAGKAGLFKGYKDVVCGAGVRRSGALMYSKNVRAWFEQLAQDCQNQLESLKAENNV